ncbi:MAG: class II glutamine amidotransferase, partial [Chitinophagales bacterium]|nr:class II glutamine amidotransferase [Chitinophagales bacterium]
MCGIIAYVGERDAYPIIDKGILRLEYRGYDSSGIGLLKADGTMNIYKKKGKYKELDKLVRGKDLNGNVGIGHIRWATHGEVSDQNAHPHVSDDGNIAVIHNGIIENYHSLRTELIKRDHQFVSGTDTEVLANLFSDIRKKNQLPLEECVRIGLQEVIGAYAIVVISKEEPNKLVAAKLSSSMLIGYGEDGYFVASDPAPLIEYTRKVTYLEDNQIAILEKDKDIIIKSITDNTPYTPYIEELKHNLEDLEKGGFDHFMLKEIFEQPRALYDSIRGRTDFENFKITLGGVKEYENAFKQAKRLIFVACG